MTVITMEPPTMTTAIKVSRYITAAKPPRSKEYYIKHDVE